MSSDPRNIGHGPDDMGDDEQETELAEYEYYLEDPPDDLIISEDDDDDAGAAADWAARHPSSARDDTGPDEPAEHSALHETREE